MSIKDLAYGTSEVEQRIIEVLEKHMLLDLGNCLEQVKAALAKMEGSPEGEPAHRNDP